MTSRVSQVLRQIFSLAYSLGNFHHPFALPRWAEHSLLTALREKWLKIGAKVISCGRYLLVQMAEVAVSGRLFAAIFERVRRLAALEPRNPVTS
jgi:hypothetical protein